MHSQQISSSTANILANLQQKISKYLSPSYESCDIFDKSKAMTKCHQEIIENNKNFIKKTQQEEFLKIQQENHGVGEFDQLINRRKKCEAKLQQMLFDHQFQEALRVGGTGRSPLTVDKEKYSVRPSFNDLLSVSSLKKVKSQAVLPTTPQPNFLKIQKQLHYMQKKLQKLCKTVTKSKSSKKSQTPKNVQKSNKISEFPKYNKTTEKPGLKSAKSYENLPPKCRSCSSKKGSSVDVSKKHPTNKLGSSDHANRQNSQETINRHKYCHNQPDQTSLFSKLPNESSKINSKANLNESKLKKVGFQKFNQNSKKLVNQQKRQQNDISKKSKNHLNCQKPQPKVHNRIKMNLIKCQSEQVL